jgi:hypothetical protein
VDFTARSSSVIYIPQEALMRLFLWELSVLLYLLPPRCHAQDEDIGKREYVSRCAVCHGEGGKEMDHSMRC